MNDKQFFYQTKALKAAGIQLPTHDVQAVKKQTQTAPQWIHFGGGNLYRAFHAEIAQTLLSEQELQTGIVVFEAFDEEVILKGYAAYQEQFIEVIMNEDGTMSSCLNAATAASYFCHPERKETYQQCQTIFAAESLQLVTLTITEKGYALKNGQGDYLPEILETFVGGPHQSTHVMGIIASLLYARYKKNRAPISLISTDNFSQNGRVFKEAVMTIAKEWVKNQLVTNDFLNYLQNPALVSFPWSMIDRITPNPSAFTQNYLAQLGLTDLELIRTKKGTVLAPFCNTESTHYLVVEDCFPNGRPVLEKAGVLITDQDTVDKADAMKVTTCLNPLHTTLAIFGCLLGYETISEAMKNNELVALIKGVGCIEGLPVVADPGIINPQKFIQELLTTRLVNPLIYDTPQRIATDTSQKMAIRFGETIRKYEAKQAGSAKELTYIPLVIAGWLRYLIGIDDLGQKFSLSPDPLLADLQEQMEPISLGSTANLTTYIQPLLSNRQLFGLDLNQIGLGEKIVNYLIELLAGPQAVQQTLKKYTIGD